MGLTDLNRPFLSVAEVRVQIKRPVENYLFCLGWQNVTQGQVLNVLFIPLEKRWRHLNLLVRCS